MDLRIRGRACSSPHAYHIESMSMGDETQKIIEEVRSDFLFAHPSFLAGLGRCLDLSGRFDFYNISPDSEIADALALYADWRAVGQELRRSGIKSGQALEARQGELFGKSPWQSDDEQDRQRTDKARISGSARP